MLEERERGATLFDSKGIFVAHLLKVVKNSKASLKQVYMLNSSVPSQEPKTKPIVLLSSRGSGHQTRHAPTLCMIITVFTRTQTPKEAVHSLCTSCGTNQRTK